MPYETPQALRAAWRTASGTRRKTEVDSSGSEGAPSWSSSLVRLESDSRGPLTVVAFDCEARLDGRKLDCSTKALEAELDQ